jgi:hypothetical protein
MSAALRIQPIEAPIHRTAKGLKYEKFIVHAREELQGTSAEQQKRCAKANLDFIKGLSSPRYGASYEAELQKNVTKAVTPAAVHVDTLLATVSVMYKNDDYVGDLLMPIVPVTSRSNLYIVYPKRERLNAPDDLLGYRASPNELDQSRSTDNYSVKDYGLKNYLDLETLQNQDAPLNEMLDVVEALNEAMALKREIRQLTILSTSGNYAGNTAARGSAWTTANTGGSVFSDVLGAVSNLWSGQGATRKVGFTTLAVWNTNIAQNQAIADRFKYTQGGLTTSQQFAGLFGLDDVVVTRARMDTANIGQTASYARILTGDFFSVLSVAQRPTVRSAHFGSTFRMQGDPWTTQWSDPSVGKRGGIYARVSISEDYKVIAGDAGFLITGVNT